MWEGTVTGFGFMKSRTVFPSNDCFISSLWNDTLAALKRKDPMSIHHSPPMKLPPSRLMNPMKIMAMANSRLIREATWVAQ